MKIGGVNLQMHLDESCVQPRRKGGGMKTEQKGYMTLEASFLVPTAVFLTAWLMLLSFYLYTVSFLNQAAYRAALRASLMLEGDRKAAAGRELDRLLQEAVLPVRELETEISVTPLAVTVELRAQLSLPYLPLLPLQEGTWQIEAEKRAQIRDAAGFIRLLRKSG